MPEGCTVGGSDALYLAQIQPGIADRVSADMLAGQHPRVLHLGLANSTTCADLLHACRRGCACGS